MQNKKRSVSKVYVRLEQKRLVAIRHVTLDEVLLRECVRRLLQLDRAFE